MAVRSEEADPDAPSESLHALVIDDDTHLAEEIGEALDEDGIRATVVGSLAGALTVLEGDPSINVVISDYFLDSHRANGIQLIDCCRTRFPDRAFRFGLMSGDRLALMDNLHDKSILKLLKPLVPQDIIARIRMHHPSSYRFDVPS